VSGFAYEGEVVLGCQEGGFAAPVVRLEDLPGGRPQDITAKGRAMFGGQPTPESLDEVLLEEFGAVGDPDDFGDQGVGRLKITVERLP
jgi:hypothetical protein